MSENQEKEKRSERRLKATQLPEELRGFIVISGKHEIKAQTTDASLNGFGFITIAPADAFITGTHIILYPKGREHALFGTVVHSSPLGKEYLRVGVQLRHSVSSEKYCEIINRLLDQTRG
jgi:hypothetical protein